MRSALSFSLITSLTSLFGNSKTITFDSTLTCTTNKDQYSTFLQSYFHLYYVFLSKNIHSGAVCQLYLCNSFTCTFPAELRDLRSKSTEKDRGPGAVHHRHASFKAFQPTCKIVEKHQYPCSFPNKIAFEIWGINFVSSIQRRPGYFYAHENQPSLMHAYATGPKSLQRGYPQGIREMVFVIGNAQALHSLAVRTLNHIV